MPRSHQQSSTSATYTDIRFCGGIGCVVLVLFLLSCASIPPARRDTLPGGESALPPRYSMVFIIHGDGNYLYHDPLGRAHRADEDAFLGALKVAIRNPQAEVFIFHQKPRRHALLFFPLRDGSFYYYRHGRLLAKESYWRDHGLSHLDPEMDFYRRFHIKEPSPAAKLFFYFGHEIPEFAGRSYDASYPDRTFSIQDLAGGLKRITHDSGKVDLVVLSTCFNGTPHSIAALAPYARTIVASPDNLHLSYFDLLPFERLDASWRDGEASSFADQFAQQAFDRLTKDIQTSVTVAVYDVDRVHEYVNSVDSVYTQALATLKGQPPGAIEHCDCAEEPEYILPGMNNGVNIFYRPPRFGRLKNNQNHSGWECWRLVR